ncbi:MAG: Na+/H+ antiporter NhaC family protein [Brevinemataceae bacterium]
MTILLMIILCIPGFIWAEPSKTNAEILGIATLVPPLLAILLAFATKKVYFSLFMGVWVGSLILFSKDGISVLDLYSSFEYITNTIIKISTDSWNASIILQVVTIGGLIAVIGKNGGSYAVASAIAKKAKSSCSAQLLTVFTALFLFFDDYANCLITGPVMRPVTDKLKISREKLAFLVDSTAAPVAGIMVISTWIGYELGILRDSYQAAGLMDPNVYQIFIKSLPYRFYNFFILGFILLIPLLNRDFGPMLTAERNARTQTSQQTNNSVQDSFTTPKDGVKYHIINALIPISVLIISCILGIWYNGYQTLSAENSNFAASLSWNEYIIQILSSADVVSAIFKAAILASITAIILSALTKTLSFFEAIEVWITGVKHLIDTVLVLILAWSLSSIIKELETSLYLTMHLKTFITPEIVPAITFILASFISFSTGSAYGTMGILMPLAIPLASSLSGDYHSSVTLLTAGSVLSGAIVGDHCSPISDTTILSSSGASCPLISHVKTQMPYTLLVTGVSIVFGYLFIALGFPLFINYIIGFSVLIGVLISFGKSPDQNT